MDWTIAKSGRSEKKTSLSKKGLEFTSENGTVKQSTIFTALYIISQETEGHNTYAVKHSLYIFLSHTKATQ